MAGIISLQAGALRLSALETPSADGRADAPVALCLHGFPDDFHSFDELAPVLAAAGFRVIAPMMPGYEPSSQPADRDYSVPALADHLRLAIDGLGASELHLIGHDWGAMVGHLIAAGNLPGLKSWTGIAIPPAGRILAVAGAKPSILLPFWYIALFQARGLADWLVSRQDWQFIDLLWRRWSPGWTPPAGALAQVKATLSAPGVRRAALGYYRALFNVLSPRFREGQRRAAQPVPVPSLILAGRRDGCFPAVAFERAINDADYPAGVRLEIIEEAGHFLHREQPALVNELIAAHLRRARGTTL
jgi:pimeloyl-ACP methyl ester carboxylesterase